MYQYCYSFPNNEGTKYFENKSVSTYHTMPRELRIRAQNAVSRGVVSRSVHSIRASLVEGRLS
jgi:hypothetical protein